jgi:hypothetical protein
MALIINSPKFPWAKIFITTIYLVNQSPTKANFSVILKEKFTCIQPNLSNLNFFGYDVTCISQKRIEKNCIPKHSNVFFSTITWKPKDLDVSTQEHIRSSSPKMSNLIK